MQPTDHTASAAGAFGDDVDIDEFLAVVGPLQVESPEREGVLEQELGSEEVGDLDDILRGGPIHLGEAQDIVAALPPKRFRRRDDNHIAHARAAKERKQAKKRWTS